MPAATARPRKRTRRARKARTAAMAESASSSSSSSSSESSSDSSSDSDSDSDGNSRPSVKAQGKARARDVQHGGMVVDPDSDSDSDVDSDSSSSRSRSSSSSNSSTSPSSQPRTRTRKTSPVPTFNDDVLLLQHERDNLRPLPNVDDVVPAVSLDESLAAPVQAYLRRKMLKDSGVSRVDEVEAIASENSAQRQEFEQFWLSAVTAELGDELDALRRREPNLTLADHPDSRLPLLIDALSAGADLFKTARGGAEQVDEIDIVLKERERLVAQHSQS